MQVNTCRKENENTIYYIKKYLCVTGISGKECALPCACPFLKRTASELPSWSCSLHDSADTTTSLRTQLLDIYIRRHLHSGIVAHVTHNVMRHLRIRRCREVA
jgi:hypothetical protein